ncbi:MAG: hypothetical protein KDJ38_16525 [Gammaproteobacteria bacterium]|nr:hypothetical protein [Gammaproteobacteria bacterium]
MLEKVGWPAILVLEGEDELTYFSGEADFAAYIVSEGSSLTDADRLVDSSGDTFTVSGSVTGPQRQTGLEEVTALVRAHLSQAGQCCVAKYCPASIGDAIRDVGADG